MEGALSSTTCIHIHMEFYNLRFLEFLYGIINLFIYIFWTNGSRSRHFSRPSSPMRNKNCLRIKCKDIAPSNTTGYVHIPSGGLSAPCRQDLNQAPTHAKPECARPRRREGKAHSSYACAGAKTRHSCILYAYTMHLIPNITNILFIYTTFT